MKVSRAWLQAYFEEPLPDIKALSDALTFHAFEIEEAAGDLLDVKVLPDRAGYALSHRGIAKELSAILQIPLKADPLRQEVPAFPKTNRLVVTADARYVLRHTGALIRGLSVGPSPAWLTERLESVGQRSINNVVDAMNYVMLDIGQPAGAFDVGKMKFDGEVLRIDIREAKAEEHIQILTGEVLELEPGMFVFSDKTSGMLLDVAGVKGGLDSGVTDATTDIFLSVGNYDGTLLRKTSQKLKVFTDAAQRFQNRPSPELTAYGMQAILALFRDIGAGGEVLGVDDLYLKKPEPRSVSVTAERIEKRLGMAYGEGAAEDVFRRLDLPFTRNGGTITVAPPFERTDIAIPEDLIEEVGRIVGYDSLPSQEFPQVSEFPDQRRFRGIERMKDELVAKGFVEVSTQSFVKKGEVMLANPLDKTRPALRPSLEETLNDALKKARLNAPLIMPPSEKPKLFEVGTVFPKEGEYVELRMTERVEEWGEKAGVADNLSKANLEEYGKDYIPQRFELGPYMPFSAYPFVLRDIALWVSGADAGSVKEVIQSAAGKLLRRIDLFDTFEKDGKKSFAFRLVFQSPERTLSDEEVNGIMEAVHTAITQKSWQVR
jgi:phenylalanyl-tRNA synthetase beta chain